MPRTDNEVRVTPSVIDRLIDYEPEVSREALASRAKSLRQFKESVKRDLEWLLNTRRTPDEATDELGEASRTLLLYGLPDFSSMSIKSPSDQKELRRSLEDAIRMFEPRLEDVVVTLEPLRENERVMRFRIDAQLRVEPAPEPVTFDTLFQIGDGRYIVQGE